MIEPDVLREHELKVRDMAYNLMDPLVTIYDKIEELKHLGVTVVNPYSQSQIVSYRLTIIKNTNNFETGICTWIIRPAIDHTWQNFKTYFEESHCLLRAVRGMTMQSSTYHHANVLASYILSEVKDVHGNGLQAFETHTAHIEMEVDEVTPLPPQAQAVNATTLDTVQLEILRVIRELQKEMKEL